MPGRTRKSRRLSKKAPRAAEGSRAGSPGSRARGAVGRGRGAPGAKTRRQEGVGSSRAKQRPTARFRRRYEWLYLYGFVRPKTGEVFWLILPTVSVEAFSSALAHFAREVGAGPDERILLVLDQPGWHTGRKLEVPEGIHLEFLPSRPPELQPAERLWPLTNEAVANRLFEELNGLEEALVKRCVALLGQTELIRSAT